MPAVTPKPDALPPTILYVVNSARFFMTHRAPLAAAAAERGWDVHVASPSDDYFNKIKRLGYECHPIYMDRKSLNPLTELRSLISLWRLYRRIKPDLVHHITIKPVIYGGLVSRLLKLTAVVHAITGLGYVFSNNSLKKQSVKTIN